MGRTDRKKWLLQLWEYHNGGLREDELKEVDDRLSEDPKARTDSQRVLGIVNELRQEGRWETHPEFPSQMVDRIIRIEKGGGMLRWVVVAVAVLLLLLFLLFGRGDSAAQGVTGAVAQVRSAILAFFEIVPTKQFDTSRLKIEPEGNEALRLHEEWIPSSSLEFDGPASPLPTARPTLEIDDPVPAIEEELNAMFRGGFAPGR